MAGPVLVVVTLASGCGSNPSAREVEVSSSDGGLDSDVARDSGAPSDGGGPSDSSSLPNRDSSVESGAGDAASSDGDLSADAGAEGAPPGDESGAGVSASFFMRYEAESPLNTLSYPVEGVVTDGASACPGTPGTASDGVREGANCASGGHVVNQILGRSPCTPPTSTTSYTDCQDEGGGVTFNDVTVPVDGTYDVTWWYHSGQETPGHADTYGDVNCGGLDYNTGPGSGCRPHLIYVNGVQMSSTVGGQKAVYYEFPAYPDSWSILHGAVTALPLKAGANAIYIKAPGFTSSDAADIDALDVQPSVGQGGPLLQPSGKGAPPALPIGLVTPVVNWN
jgi:hypothetical protein